VTVLELNYSLGAADRSAAAHFVVDGREYLILTTRGLPVTVLAGRWIKDRRALGRTFHDLPSLAAHYKKDGAVLVEYATRLLGDLAVPASEPCGACRGDRTDPCDSRRDCLTCGGCGEVPALKGA
jgi:hypothetical protein